VQQWHRRVAAAQQRRPLRSRAPVRPAPRRDPAQIVEAQLRRREDAQLRTRLGVEMAQEAVAQSVAGQRPQLLLDQLERPPQRRGCIERVSDIERDLGYLGQQKDRLDTLLTQLETERAEFQTQLWGLDRQVDAISRNDRMIEIMQKRQVTIDEHSRYSAASLDQINARLADIRAKQESKLEMFAQNNDIKNYENAAKYMIDGEKSAEPRQLKRSHPKTIEITPSVIEIGPGDVIPVGPAPSQGPVASKG